MSLKSDLVARAYKLTLLAANFPIQLGVSDNLPVLNSIVYTPHMKKVCNMYNILRNREMVLTLVFGPSRSM